MFAAVVARPDEKWGETPCAFVERNKGYEHVTAQELLDYCRANLAHYKCPRHVVFLRPAQDLQRKDSEIQASRAGQKRRLTRRITTDVPRRRSCALQWARSSSA